MCLQKLAVVRQEAEHRGFPRRGWRDLLLLPGLIAGSSSQALERMPLLRLVGLYQTLCKAYKCPKKGGSAGRVLTKAETVKI